MKNIILILIALIIVVLSSGCATYRTSSNIESEPAYVIYSKSDVVITENDITDREYRIIGPLEVSVKKLFIFNKDPTKKQANDVLIEKARAIGADAVINVTYESGIGFTTYGYMDAKGTAVKFSD